MEQELDKLSLYEINRQGYSKIEPLTDEKIEEKLKDIPIEINHYSMLLCREMYDYTTFISKHTKKSNNNLKEIILSILKNRGKILDIENNETVGCVEFWVKHKQDDEPHMYVLFDATGFVITV